MKTLALRAFLIIALGCLAHSIKPFTSENLTSYAATTAHSLAVWLPETAVSHWEKTAALATALTNTWRAEGGFPAGLQPMLAARLQSGQPSLHFKRTKQRTAARILTRAASAPELGSSETADAEEIAETEEVVAHSSEETIRALLERATLSPSAEATKTFAAPLPVSSGQKNAACPMPVVTDTVEPTSPAEPPVREAESEVAPTLEPESQPLLLRQPRLPHPLEIEAEPVRWQLTPRPARVRSLIKRAATTAAKC